MPVDIKTAVQAAVQSTLNLASGFSLGGYPDPRQPFAEFGLPKVIEATAEAGMVISVGFVTPESVVGTFGDPTQPAGASE